MKTVESTIITEDMLINLKNKWTGKVSDIDVLQLLRRNILCENVAVYDKLMDYCNQLHISAYGNRENLTITT